jgi:fibronectin-binding autotransporter adhesin
VSGRLESRNFKVFALLSCSVLALTAAPKVARAGGTFVVDVTTDTSLTTPIVTPPGYDQTTFAIGNMATLTLQPGSDPTATVFVEPLTGSGALVNNGNITTAGPAIESDGFNVNYPSVTVTNNGAITANLTGVPGGYAISNGAYELGDITNAGNVTATGGGGIYAFANYSLTNSGNITADATAVYAFDNVVTNSGTIHSNQGVGLYALGDVGFPASNTGTIYGEIVGAELDGYTLTNYGNITSPGLAVGLDPYGTLINKAGGVINGNIAGELYGYTFDAGVDNAGTINGDINYGVFVTQTSNYYIGRAGSVLNGNLSIGVGTVTNAGLINGGATSVIFSGLGASTLTLQTGSTLVGDAVGSTTVGATNALILQGNGTANNNFDNFNTLDMQGNGTWTLGGNSTIGNTSVTAGTLVVTGELTSAFTIHAGATLQGSSASLLAQGAVVDSGALVFDQATDGTFANAITGTGNLTKQNSGALTLSGASAVALTTVAGGSLIVTGTLTSAITVDSGGTLQGTTASLLAQGPIVDNGQVVFDQAADGTFAGAVTGSGSLTKQNAGALTLSGASSVASTTVAGGTLIVTGSLTSAFVVDSGATLQGNTSTLLAQGGVVDNGQLVFDQAANATFANAITGTGNLTKENAGTLTLSGTSSLGSTTVADGTLIVTGPLTSAFSVGSGATLRGASSTLLGAIADGGAVVFDQAVDGTSADAIAGAGNLTKLNSGNLTLSGTSSVGSTTVAGGALIVTGALASAFSIDSGATLQGNSSSLLAQGTVADNGALVFDQAANGAFANAIVGSGSLVKENSGLLVLDGISAVATTAVNGGNLQIGDAAHPTAQLTSAVSIAAGATLSGHGTIVGNVTNNGGTVAPGGTIGTLTINGDYTQSSTGTLSLEVTPTTSSTLVVTGVAHLAGTLQLVTDPGLYRKGTTYDFLNAGSVTGAFSSVTSTNGVPFDVVSAGGGLAAVATAGNVVALGGTRNQTAVEHGFVNYPMGVSDFDPVANALIALPTNAQQNAAFDRLGGEIDADFLTVGRDRTRGFLGGIEDQQALHGEQDTTRDPALWGYATGGADSVDGDGNAHSFNLSSVGAVIGGDADLGANTTLGLAGSYDHSTIGLSGSPQSGDLDAGTIGLYGEQRLGIFFVDAAGSFSFDRGQSRRTIAFSTIDRRADGTFTGNADGVLISVGARLRAPGDWLIEPALTITETDVRQGGFTEAGATGADLAVSSKTEDSTESIAGARFSKAFGDSGWRVDGQLAWAHEFNDAQPNIAESFAAAPGTGFELVGAKPGQDFAVFGAGLNFKATTRLSFFGRYDGAFGGRQTDQSGDFGFKYAW